MSGFGGWAVAGQGALEQTSEREIIWGGDDRQPGILRRNAVIDGAARDAGNSPTTVLRRGLLLGKVTATGQYKEWNPDGSDGSEYLAGILNVELRAQDFNATNIDRAFAILTKAPLRAAQLLVEGTALTSSTDGPLARRQLRAMGCVLDDDPAGHLAGAERYETNADTADTLTAADNGKTIFYTNAAAVLVTLPAAAPGLEFDIIRAGDEEIVVASPTADNIIVGNDLSADSITFTTSGQHLGARIKLRSAYVGTTIKWICELPNMPFGTGLTGGFAYAIATA